MKNNLSLSLLMLRLSVFLVMFMWTLDKFINPGHAAKVFEHFYFLPNSGETLLAIVGSIQMIIIIAFVIGFKKKISYGLVFIMHFISTVSSFNQYLNPWENLLFFAAWPMLAACFALYSLRDKDKLLSLA